MNEQIILVGMVYIILAAFYLHLKGMFNLLSKEISLVQELLEKKLNLTESLIMRELDRRVPANRYPLEFSQCDFPSLDLPLLTEEDEIKEKAMHLPSTSIRIMEGGE